MNLNEITLPDMSGGLNTREPQYEIADNQSPDMLNLWFKDRALVKRPGQQIAVEGFGGNVHSISDEYNGFRVIHAGTRYYKWDEAGTKNYKGEFNPSKGYPISPSDGEYYVASESGTVGGTYYSTGEKAVYSSTYPQLEGVTLDGTVTAAGKAKVTITGVAFENGRITVETELEHNDTCAKAAEKIRLALGSNDNIAKSYEAAGRDGNVVLKQKKPAPFDQTLCISITNETCAGLAEKVHTSNTMWHKAAEEIFPAETNFPPKDEKGAFVLFGDVLYHFDGEEIREIKDDMDGILKFAAVVPYVPTVMINCVPDLSESADLEAYNLLSGGFRVKYNGNAGGNVCYYVATVPTTGTFTVTEHNGSTTPMTFTTVDVSGWKIKKQGGSWISATPDASFTGSDKSTITLSNHGLSVMDAVQFDPGTGTLPGGLKAWDSDEVKVYKLPVKKLDSLEAVVEINADKSDINNYVISKGTDGNMQIEFNEAPPTGTDNVWITACSTVPGYKKRITGCKSAVAFGGESGGVTGGTRVFVGANPGYPQCYWHSDIGLHIGAGMGYFPDTGEEMLDQTAGAINAMAKMGSELVIFKDSSIFAVRYSYDGKDVYFPVRECNGFIGCDMPGSVQLIDNRLVFANTRSGVNMLISTSNELENIVKPLSANINGLLLKETGLKGACSCDYDRHYWLCVNGIVYLWDYDKTPYYNYSDYEQAQRRLSWYRWDGVKAKTFCAGDSLYFGFEGGIAWFTNARNDFGSPYEAYFTSKAFDLGRPEDLKTFMYLYPSFTSDGNVKVRVSIGSENDEAYVSRDFEIESFDWRDFNWGAFTWNIYKYARTFSMRLAMKKISYIQIKVSGLEENRGMGLSGLRATYFINKKTKE